MKFKYTILYVENVKQTLDFYKKAFGFPIGMLHESGDYGELDTGQTVLSFSSLALMTALKKSPARPTSKAPVFEIAFETDDVPAALEKALAAGAKLVQDTEEMEWGQTVAYVSDPNDFLVEICTAVKPPE